MTEKPDESLEQEAAARYTGRVERLYAGHRVGLIVAVNGQTVAFRRRDLIAASRNSSPWIPELGELVLFDRLLLARGPWAVKVRPSDSRRLPTASSAPGAGPRARQVLRHVLD